MRNGKVFWKVGFLSVFALLIAFGGYFYSQLRALEVEKLSEDLFVFRGMGGNTTVLKTDAGNVIVDTMTTGTQGQQIRRKAKQLTGMDTVLLINTHYHLDHTHGNPAFDIGTKVVSTERTLSYLKSSDGEFWKGDAEKLLPNDTFSVSKTIEIGGKTIELIHPGAGHTDGDLVVLFKDERVAHLGDLYFNKHYPNIDLEAGGTVQYWPQTLENVLALDFDRVVPGHGATSDRSGVAAFQAFLVQLGAIARSALAEGKTLEQTIQSKSLTADAGYEPIRFIVPIGLDREFVLKRAWEEVNKDFKLMQ